MINSSLYRLTFLPLALALFVGCGSSSPQLRESPPTAEYLQDLGAAYFAFTLDRGRPPKKMADIAPIISEWGKDVNVIKVSPRDGQDFVIAWGVDLRKAELRDDAPPIIAYERTSVEGKRYVCNSREAYEMTDDEISSAYFPSGHTPPIHN